MESSIFHKLSSMLWVIIVALVVLLAIHVSVGRLVMSNLSMYQSDILQELNKRVPFRIEAERVSGDWQSFTPILVLSGLRLNVPGTDEPIELSEGRIGIDVLDSLFTRTLQVTRLRLEGLSLRGELSPEGQIRISGFEGGGGPMGAWIQEFLLNVEQVSLDNNLLLLTLPGGEARSLDLDLDLYREGSRRQVEANLVSSRGAQIKVLASGVGNPFRPAAFSGELYLDIGSSDLGAAQELLPPDAPMIRAEGSLALEVWLSWDKGARGMTGRIEARDLLLADVEDSWQLPLHRVAMEATLVERKNRWTLYGSNLEIQQDSIDLRLPRLQLDAWGEALRLRAGGVPLAPLNDLLIGLDGVPVALADVFGILRPRGLLSSLQFSIGDIGNPGDDWELEANFEDLEVESWKGAPGVASAAGYAQLAPGGGFVVLDSQDFAMEFPKIYGHALAFDDIHGTIKLDWDDDDLVLSSGPIAAMGPEGEATVLFGLNIPLRKNEVGIEMDLMVGLSGFDPVHRDKYLPYILNDSLLNWLSASIDDGRIEQGAFLWRGSLPPQGGSLRTVQLFFNVSDTDLRFDPAWPPLSGVDSIVLIDDTNVSVWAEQAAMFDLRAARMSAEAWMGDDGQMRLAVKGNVQGPAEDGLALLNDSPIGELLGGGFEQWTLAGDMAAELSLQLNLAAGAMAPVVDVRTLWREVDVGIEPGNLLLRGVDGELRYSTEQGLYAPALTGTLWGQPLAARIKQRPAESGEAYDPSSSIVEVLLDGQVDMASVQRWLQLDALAFASGKARVTGRVDIAPGTAPVMYLDSTLAGVSLDFPQPWKKNAREESQFHLSLPLAGDGMILQMELDEQVRLNLALGGGGLQGGTLAFHEPPTAPRPGVLAISGRLVAMDVEQWTGFVTDYFSEAVRAVIPETVASASDEGEVAESVAALPSARVPPVASPLDAAGEKPELTLEVDALQVDRLTLYGQELHDVDFSLAIEGQHWRGSAANDWLRGDLSLNGAGGISTLDIAYLDLSGLTQLELSGSGDGSPLELPTMEVTLRDLRQGARQLGNLNFHLRTEAGTLYASDITGEIAAMQLQAERPAQLSWRQGEESRTDINARLRLEDLGQTLQLLGYQQILETRKGSLELSLQWPGAPQEFSLQQGQGSLLVDLERGSFLEAPSGASGALRVVSVLNLADIVTRLSLSHMFESGIPFDSVDGEVYLHGGTIEVAGMEVHGSSSFRFSGLSNVSDRSLEGELVATLPVANNLPWVAALAGGLPVAAGVFVVSKVFEKQFARLSSAVYAVGGTWDDPQVAFARIFDDSESRPADSPRPLIDDPGSGMRIPPAAEAGLGIVPVTLDPNAVQSASP